MKLKISILTLLASAIAVLAAPAPEQLLPNDTLAVFTVPDWDKAKAITGGSPFVKFWNDPAMKPFREKFEKKWEEEIVKPMERDMGMKLPELLELVHGQVTIAVLKPLTEAKGEEARWVMLLDSKDAQGKLTETLANAKKRWIEANKEQKTETVRGVEFTTYIWMPTNAPASGGQDANGSDLDEVLPEKDRKEHLAIGQSGSLMLAGSNAKDFEKILVRLSGGIAPSLAEVGAFERNANALFRNSYAWGWADVKHFTDLLLKSAEEAGESANPLAPAPGKIVGALGIGDLTTIALAARNTGAGGEMVEFFVGIPASSRKGLLKLLSWEAKDSAPPAFVPADTVKFSRSRIDLRQMWTTVENLLKELSPPLAAFVQMGIENAGKDRDPNFDLRKALVNSLGDDLITMQRAARSSSPADLQNPPTLYLLGSGTPDQLVLGIRAAMSLLPPPMNDIAEREFLGRKVFAVKMNAPRGQPARQLHFARSGSYVAMSTDVAFLEEFLRNAESSGRSLRETPGLAEAAQQVGGMNTGWFSFENQKDQMRVLFELAKNDPAALSQSLANQGRAAAMAGVGGDAAGDAAQKMNEWFDFKLLPDFAAVAKYFHFQLGSVANTSEGISIKSFFPTPPEMK